MAIYRFEVRKWYYADEEILIDAKSKKKAEEILREYAEYLAPDGFGNMWPDRLVILSCEKENS